MTRIPATLALTGLALAAAGVFAADKPPPTRVSPSPMMVELLALAEGESVQMEKLYTEFSAAADEVAAMSIQRRIEELKYSTERESLRLQLRYAREERRLVQADRLENTLNMLESQHSKSQ